MCAPPTRAHRLVHSHMSHTCADPGAAPHRPHRRAGSPATPSCEAEDLPLSRPCLCVLVLTLCHQAMAFHVTHACRGPELGVPSARPVEPHTKPVHEGCLPEASLGGRGQPAGARAHFPAPWAVSRPQAHRASGKGPSSRPCGLEYPGVPHFISKRPECPAELPLNHAVWAREIGMARAP